MVDCQGRLAGPLAVAVSRRSAGMQPDAGAGVNISTVLAIMMADREHFEVRFALVWLDVLCASSSATCGGECQRAILLNLFLSIIHSS